MYIIIAGAGVVGFHIASLLIEEKHEVTIIEQSEDAIENIRGQLDVRTVIGNTATPKLLREAEVHRADLIIAVTNNDETNMLTCFLAKELGAAMTVARVRNPEYSGYFITAAKSPSATRKVIRPKSLGIDLFTNPEFEAAREMFIQQLREYVRGKLNAEEDDDEIHEAVSVWKPLPVSSNRLVNHAFNSVSRLSPDEMEELKAKLEQQSRPIK